MTFLLNLFQISMVLFIFSPNNDNMFPEIEGLQKMGDIEIYNPDNLYDIINGAADSYLKYDFEELKLVRYKGVDDQFLKIEIYRHSTNATAFGIYSNERPSKGNWVDVGVQGYYESKILNFYKGRYYVKLMGYKIDNIEELLLSAAQIVGDNLEGNNELPILLESFPKEGKIEYSERYIHKEFLGYRSLTEAFLVDYEVDGKDFKMFLIKKSDAHVCRKMLEDYFTTIGIDKMNIQKGRIQVDDAYQGKINILWEDNIVIGVMNCTDTELIKKHFEYMSNKLNVN
jgi:hypothetical protein